VLIPSPFIGVDMMGMGKTSFLTSDEAFVGYSAVVATPIVMRTLTPRLPRFTSSGWGILAIVGFVILLIARKLRGKARAIVTGIGAAMFINAILSIPALSPYLSRLGV